MRLYIEQNHIVAEYNAKGCRISRRRDPSIASRTCCSAAYGKSSPATAKLSVWLTE